MGNKKKHHQDKKERQFEQQDETIDPPEKVEQPQESQPTEEVVFELIEPKQVEYCRHCSLTLEVCKCEKGVQEVKQAPKDDRKGKSVKEKYIMIDVKNRGRKNYITTVSGLNNFGIDCKDLSKKCSKKFAVSCSAIDEGTIQLQGDNQDAIREFILSENKQLKKRYILDKAEFTEKNNKEVAKKKQAKKQQKMVIQQEPEKQQQQQQEKNINQIRYELMKKAEEEVEDDD